MPEELLPDELEEADPAAELPQRAAVETLTLVGIRGAKKRAFLRAYCEVGTITGAAQLAGIHRHTHGNWKRDDPAYAEAFEEAKEIYTEMLEAEVDRRAFRGVLRAVRYEGKVVGYEREYLRQPGHVPAQVHAPRPLPG